MLVRRAHITTERAKILEAESSNISLPGMRARVANPGERIAVDVDGNAISATGMSMLGRTNASTSTWAHIISIGQPRTLTKSMIARGQGIPQGHMPEATARGEDRTDNDEITPLLHNRRVPLVPGAQNVPHLGR